MKEKIFRAHTMAAGLKLVTAALGSEAIILKSRRIGDEVELTALADDGPDQYLDDPVDADNVKVEFTRARERMLSERVNWVTGQVESAGNQSAEKQPEPAAENDFAKLTGGLSPDFSAFDKLLGAIGGKSAADLSVDHRSESYTCPSDLMAYAGKMGLSGFVCQRLNEQGCFERSDLPKKEALRNCMDGLASLMEISDEKNRQAPAIRVFIGPSGGGKTTTLSKLATRHVLQYGNHNLALIGFDNYRMAADDQLRKLARLLDVPVRFVSSNAALDAVLTSVNERPFIFLDTAGLGMGGVGLRNQLRTLDHSVFRLKKVLVLPANLQERTMRTVIDTFASKDIDSCILTKLDDCASLGESISVLVEEQIPLAYVTNGPNIPEDLQIARSDEVIREACRLMQSKSSDPEVDGNHISLDPINTNVGFSY